MGGDPFSGKEGSSFSALRFVPVNFSCGEDLGGVDRVDRASQEKQWHIGLVTLDHFQQIQQPQQPSHSSGVDHLDDPSPWRLIRCSVSNPEAIASESAEKILRTSNQLRPCPGPLSWFALRFCLKYMSKWSCISSFPTELIIGKLNTALFTWDWQSII